MFSDYQPIDEEKKYNSCHKFNEILVTGTDISLSEPPCTTS